MSARTLLRRTSVAGVTLLIAGGAAGAMAASASASTTQPRYQPRETAGSVELGSPLQYEQFLAIQGGRFHGDVDYTNWTYLEPGSGVFAPAAGPHALVFTYRGSQYDHTLNGGLRLVALSPNQLAFAGHGSYSGQAGATWAISGRVTDRKVKATITYNGTLEPGYRLTLTGTVANNGSVSGIAESSQGQALTFTLPAGSFASVLHYVAPIRSAQVQRNDARFQFTIPASVPGLAGTKVTVKVHDGGFGRARDKYAAGVTGTTLTAYPIIGGPGVYVHA